MVGPGLQARVHALRVEYPSLLHHIAALDAGGFFDEFDTRGLYRLTLSGADLGGMAAGFQIGKLVEGRDQLLVAYGVRGNEKAGAAERDVLDGLGLA